MPSINREIHDITCDLSKYLLTFKVGEKIEIQLKDEKIVWERIE